MPLNTNHKLLWTPTYGQAKAGRPARTYIQQLCEDTGCNPEDLPEAMNDREKWREMVRDIRASGTTWWWWWCLLMCSVLLFSLLGPYNMPSASLQKDLKNHPHHHKECPECVSKPSDSETPVQGNEKYPSFPLLPYPLWLEMVVHVRITSMVHIELFNQCANKSDIKLNC